MNILIKNEPRTAAPATPRRSVAPRYDLRENENAYVVTAQVPGVERTALETTIDGERLTVIGRRSWTAPENWTAIYREIPDADYRLVLELDHRVNREGIEAQLNQGILTLTIPKAEAVKARKIEIKG